MGIFQVCQFVMDLLDFILIDRFKGLSPLQKLFGKLGVVEPEVDVNYIVMLHGNIILELVFDLVMYLLLEFHNGNIVAVEDFERLEFSVNFRVESGLGSVVVDRHKL